MSIQSSVNALIGTIGAIKKANDVGIMQKANIELKKQQIAKSEQKSQLKERELDLMEQREERLRGVSPIKAQAELEKYKAQHQEKRNERYRLGTERLIVKGDKK